MKKGIASIFIAITGFYFLYKYNALMHEIYHSIITGKEIRFIFIDDLTSFKRLFMIIITCISLLSFYLGTISFLKKNKIGIAGIVLATLLFIAAFIPFWKYVIEDSGIDTIIN